MTTARQLAHLLGDLSGQRPPRYAALADRLRLLVADGRLPVGARLPAERELAGALHVSRATITMAYSRLRSDGWADARRGAGTWTALPGTAERSAWVPGDLPPEAIDLVHAAPAAPPQLATAYAAALDELPRLLPGHGYSPAGLPELRARLAERYCHRGLPTTANQVLITSGALHGLDLALGVLASRGQRAIVEAPGYPNLLDAVRGRGLRPVPVAVPDDDPAGFVELLARTAGSASAAVAVLTPDFQNPTGQLLDDTQRSRAAGALRRAGTVPLVDETLADLSLDVDAPLPFGATDRAPSVTVGSLSKSVWGGLRVGWIRAEPGLVRQLTTTAAMRSDMAGPVLEQLAACHLLDGFDAVLSERRAALRTGRTALLSALAGALPAWQVRPPAGGLVLWCRLPDARSSALVAAAEPLGLHLAAGPRFSTGHAFDDRVRLPYTQPVEALHRAVELLTQADTSVKSGVPRQSRAAQAELRPVA